MGRFEQINIRLLTLKGWINKDGVIYHPDTGSTTPPNWIDDLQASSKLMDEHGFELSVHNDMVLVYKDRDQPPLSILIYKDYPSRDVAIRCALVRAAIEELQQLSHAMKKPSSPTVR